MDMQEPNATDDRAPDFDSPWKEAISAYFRPFMALFFPVVQELIDCGPTSFSMPNCNASPATRTLGGAMRIDW
jgi:hypothetical protein